MLICALFGKPVGHSLSPVIHGELARAAGLELGYIKVEVPEAARLPQYLEALQTLGGVGANVTLPYKVDVVQYLHQVDASAAVVGAANTVVMDPERGFIGYNTDGLGAVAAMDARLRKVVKGDRIVILGAGGAARAIAHAVCLRGAEVDVLTPVAEEVDGFSQALSPSCAPHLRVEQLTESVLLDRLHAADFLVNATPLGMSPREKTTAVPESIIQALVQARPMQTLHVLDAVYSPRVTRLLATCSKAGAQTCSGLWMLIYQGKAAFHLFTGHDPGTANLPALYELLSAR